MKGFMKTKNLILAGSLLFSFASEAGMHVIEAKAPLKAHELKELEKTVGAKITRFLPFGDDYLQRLYEADLSSKSAKALKNDKRIARVEADHSVELYEIKPNRRSEMFTKDMLYAFQWGLQNQEQIISAQMPNGGPEETKGVLGTDISWKSSIKEIEGKLKKSPVVAVIDMGIDFDHPELKDQIYKNDIECDDGKIQLGENREDRDKNGLPGDCMGWNFAATSRLDDARPLDDKGHGTHVSGIIAAKRDNHVGVSGVSDKIKILPIRVTGMVDETEDRDKLFYRAASRRIAKGIFYAVHRGADVINLSLGWPKSMNTFYMTRALNVAINSGVTIVAAAGNNNTNANIYPCAVREVVCVGSVDVDGKVSRFSNYGGEVDILAPGDQIVSTIPTQFIPLKLNINGYDILSGTSQAAPFVSAAAALLKGLDPEMDNNEIQRRLFDSARPRPDSFKSMHGLLQIDKAVNLGNAPSVKPVFKQMSETLFDPRNGEFRPTILNVKNFGLDAESVHVEIQSLTDGIAIQNASNELGELKSGGIANLPLRARVVSKLADSKIRLKVSVSVNGGEAKSYTHEMTLSKDLYGIAKKDIVPIKFSGEQTRPLISFRREYDEATENRINRSDRATRSNLRTVEEKYPKGFPSYYLTYNDPEKENVTEVFFYHYNGSELAEQERALELENVLYVDSVTKLDYNYDGKDDYLVKTVAKVNNQKLDIQYRYLNADLTPLYADMPLVHYYMERGVVSLTPKTERFIKTKIGDDQYLATGVFVNTGGLPEEDQIVNPWFRKDESVRRRVYRMELVLDNGEPQFKARTFMNKKFNEEARELFGDLIPFAVSVDDAGIETIGMNLQSQDDYIKGKVSAVYSFGLGFERYAVEADLTSGGPKLSLLDEVGNRLVGNAMHPVTELTSGKSLETNSFVGFLTSSTVNLSHVKDGKEKNYVYRLDTPYDRITSFIASFEKNDKAFMFFETIDDILMVVDDNGNRKESRLNTSKFSFLPGQMMSDIFFPIAMKSQGGLEPAIYIDSTSVAGSRIYSMVSVNDELKAPVDLSVGLPEVCGYEERYCGLPAPKKHYGTLYCAPMNPLKNADGSYSYMVLCKRQRNYEMIKIDLDL